MRGDVAATPRRAQDSLSSRFVSVYQNQPSGSYVYSNDNYLSVGSNQNWANRIVICMNGSAPSITFECDGTVTFGEAYTLNEVAKFVWESFAACNPMHGEVSRLKQEIETLKRQLDESKLPSPNV